MKTEKQKYERLGREIKISPKALIAVNPAGFKTEHFTPTVEVLIGIGKDHTAKLIMDTEALEALRKWEPIDITTAKEFRKNIK
jgi:hypothetical protein